MFLLLLFILIINKKLKILLFFLEGYILNVVEHSMLFLIITSGKHYSIIFFSITYLNKLTLVKKSIETIYEDKIGKIYKQKESLFSGGKYALLCRGNRS